MSAILATNSKGAVSCFPLYEIPRPVLGKIYGSIPLYKRYVAEYSAKSLYPVHNEDGNTVGWDMYDPGADHLRDLDRWVADKKARGYRFEWSIDES